MKVCFVHTSSMSNLRGSERWLLDMCSILRNQSIVSCIANFDCDSSFKLTKEESDRRYLKVKNLLGKTSLVRMHAFRLRPYPRRLLSGTRLGSIIDRNFQCLPIDAKFLRLIQEADVLYFVQAQPEPIYLIFVLLASSLMGRKPVIDGIHVVPRVKSHQIAVLKLFFKLGILRGIHTVDQRDAILMQRQVGCPSEYIPNGVFLEKFTVLSKEKAVQERFSILFVGAMSSNKGADLIPKIHSCLQEAGVDFDLVLCTTGGPMVQQLRDWSTKTKNVTFKGFVDENELLQLYSKSSLVLLPSREEQFGLVSLESQASGTPVVASQASGYTQTIVDGETGFFVKEYMPRAFADKIRYVYNIWLTDRPAYLRICNYARKNVQENFQWTQTAPRLAAFIENAALRKN